MAQLICSSLNASTHCNLGFEWINAVCIDNGAIEVTGLD